MSSIVASDPGRTMPVGCARPSRTIPKQRSPGSPQLSCVFSTPRGSTHVTSFTSSSALCTPTKKRLRRRIGYALRSCMQRRVKAASLLSSSVHPSQSSHVMSALSWRYALLLPYCVLPISSPASSIGVPCEKKSVAMKLRFWRSRNALISGSSVSPSAPQFHELLFELPSRLSSLFASLCLSLYETRSFRQNPSCAVMKLTLAHGLRPRWLKRSAEAVSRVASSGTLPSSPFQ